jgi:hypothetical protein
MSLGVLLMVLGGVWTLQGLNVLTDAQMSGQDLWAKIGPGVAVAGLILVVVGVRLRSWAKRRAAAEVTHP